MHERSVDSDFLLIVLREALAANPNLRVVLMSATLDASLFADYFGGCAVLNIPGRTFPITDFTIEDAIERTGYLARGKKLLLGSDAEQELEALDQARDDGAVGRAPEVGMDGEVGAEYSERTRQALLRLPAGAVPADLVVALLGHLDERDASGCGGGSTGGGGGAVLIFLPGVAEIRRLAAELSRSASASRWLLLPLHGELPPDQQRKVFGRPPKGLRKVVIATNVAETSLTIDDVRVVIDSGRVKLNQYDTLNATAQLVETYAAPCSARRAKRGPCSPTPANFSSPSIGRRAYGHAFPWGRPGARSRGGARGRVRIDDGASGRCPHHLYSSRLSFASRRPCARASPPCARLQPRMGAACT